MAQLLKAFAGAAIVASTVVPGGSAGAIAPTDVDFTVHETLPLSTPGVMIASDIAACPAASVATVDATVSTAGPVTTFRGTKVVDCGGGDTFSLDFRANVMGCSATDAGTWKLVGGTGAFAGAKGQGQLVGSYTLGGGAGTACINDGIDDRYTGKIKFAS